MQLQLMFYNTEYGSYENAAPKQDGLASISVLLKARLYCCCCFSVYLHVHLMFVFFLFVCAPICLFVLFCYSVSRAGFVFTTQSKFPFCKLYIKSLLDHKKRVLGCLYVKVTPCEIRDDKFGKLALKTRHLVLHRHRPQRV